MFAIGALIVTLLIGLRFEVGGDWNNYERLFSYANYADLERVLAIGDPGYQLLNWIVQRAGGKFYWVNLICGSIFSWGLWRFSRSQPAPWLAFMAAVPYLIIVVGMGYSRQATAIGIVMAGFAALARGRSVWRFTIYVAFAALFHRTAILVLPLVVFAGQRNNLLSLVGGIGICVYFYDVFLGDSLEKFVKNYVESEYRSQGAWIRVTMNLLPALLILLAGKRLGLEGREARIWRTFSYAALAALAMLMLTEATAAVDRAALYVLPLQLVAWSRLGISLTTANQARVLVVVYSGMVLAVWLNFAVHAGDWIPYQFYPMDKWES